jgi:hypothetical protein
LAPDENAEYRVVQIDAPEVTDDHWTQSGADWLLQVPCPRCGHTVERKFGPEVLAHYRERSDAGDDAVMLCNCDATSHAGREGGDGCGAWWGFEVETR